MTRRNPERFIDDPILLALLWNRLICIVEEEATTLVRTAFSSVLTDAGDLAAGLFDTKGNMVAQAFTGTPGHINSMATGVRHFMKHHPPDTLEPGDVLLGNNAYEISGHLMDMTIVTPVFYGRRLVGFFASTCHTVDIGGRGYTADTDSIFEEGLHLPYLKYYQAGRPSEAINAIIAGNSRAPVEVLGDLRAQVIANAVAIRRLLEMMDEFGLKQIDDLGEEIIRRTELAMRRAISEVPDGVYRNETFSDGFEEPVNLKCCVHVHGDEITVDLAGSSPASIKGINVCLNYARAYVQFTIKAALAPDIPNNEGSFRPVHALAPEGCIVNARHPMPTTARHIVGHFLPDCVLGALHLAIPGRVLAEGAATSIVFQVMGEKENGEPFAYVFFSTGGMGARPAQDGLSATPFPSGVRGTPVEIIENASPLVVHLKELCTDSGGPGKYRGGLGQVVRLGVRSERPYRMPIMIDRTRFAASGLAGGLPGAMAKCLLNQVTPLLPTGDYRLQPSDVVTFHLPGGGGYGHPAERDSNSVVRDVVRGYVSPEAARDIYRVAVEQGSNGWELNAEQTKMLRQGNGS